MPRFSLLTTPHKGLRFALAELCLMAGKTDYTQAREVARLQSLAKNVFSFLEEHAEVEEIYILPRLENRIPGTTNQDVEDHEHLSHLQQKIERTLNQLSLLSGNTENANITGQLLYQDLTRLLAGHLDHMLEEEEGTQRLMWECFSDEVLMEIHTQVVSTFTPEQLMNSLRFILPAQNHLERCLLMKSLKTKAPAAFFDQVSDLARIVLDQESYEKLNSETFSLLT